MNLPKLKPLAIGRLGRTALVLVVAGGMFLGAEGIAEASVGNNPGAVQLNPASGSTSSTPTWSTSVGCNAGFQGSAVLRDVESDGVTTDSISQAVNGTANPFSGTLQASMAQIQALGSIPNGGTQELVVVCFSGPSLTGTSSPEMNIFVTYSADGSTYSTGSTSVPVGEIGGIAFAGLAGIGLVWMQLRRRSRRRQLSLT
jgi:hypothetical protein